MTGSPCEMTSNKVIILIITVVAAGLIFYGISTVYAVPEVDIYLDRMHDEIGNYSGIKIPNDTSFVDKYIEEVGKEIGKSLPKN